MHPPEQLWRNHCQHQPDCQRQRGGNDHHHRKTIARKQPRQRPGPGVFGPCFSAPFGQRQRHIHREFMRRRILAGMITGTAMVAQIGKLRGIADIEQTAALHRREHSAEALTITAGIADLHDPRCFFMRRCACHFDQADIIHGAIVPVCLGSVVLRFSCLAVQLSGGSAGGLPQPRRCGRRRPRWSCRSRQGSPGQEHCRP